MTRVSAVPSSSGTWTPQQLRQVSRRVRTHILRMAHAAKAPHVGSAFSCVEILVALYFRALRVSPDTADHPDRDRCILSKGHGCTAQYAVLAERGFFPADVLQEYAVDGGRLAEHPGPGCVPGIEVATGSLGHGLSVGIGMAYAARLRQAPYRVFVVLSDGECHEGSVWEGAMSAPAHRLDNVVAIIDYNKWSALGRSGQPMALEPLAEKWAAFGWHVVEVDGHDLEQLTATLGAVPSVPGRPTAVIAHTVKGKGVSFMEDDLEWHYRPPAGGDLARALAELEQDRDA